MSELLKIIEGRRSIRVVQDEALVPDGQLAGLLRDALNTLPTAFNVQNTRMVLLLNDEHRAFWNDIVTETLRKKVPPEKFGRTERKLAGFAGGHGTVLFFNDEDAADTMKQELPAYAENVDSWELQHNGMLQISTWLLLVEQGYGVSIQHYNPIVDDAVKQRWGLPEGWRLLAQMPFGKPGEQPEEKEFEDIEKRFKVFGGK